MADAHHELVVVEQLWAKFQVAVDRIVKVETIALRPMHKTALPVVPAARCTPERDLVVAQVFL